MTSLTAFSTTLSFRERERERNSDKTEKTVKDREEIDSKIGRGTQGVDR